MTEPERMADFFNVRAADYDRAMRENVDDFAGFYGAVGEAIPAGEQARQVLVLGCGTGLELPGIRARLPQATVVGLDLAGAMLRQLQAKLGEQEQRVQLLQGSYLALPFAPGRFDLVLAVMTLHHLLPARRRALYRDVRALLRPGGLLVEGDFVVSPAAEAEYRVAYEAQTAGLEGAGAGRYHLDLPLSLPTLARLLEGSGFAGMEVLWHEGAAAVWRARLC